MSNQEEINGSAKDEEKLVKIIQGMSELVYAGLNMDATKICIDLLGAGMDPQVLAKEIKLMKIDAHKQQQQKKKKY